MPVTLAESLNNAVNDIDLAVISEFLTNPIMDLMVFDDVVNPAGGGATLTYGYRRQLALASANFRAINSEYIPSEISTARFTVDLKVLGGSFQIDRVLTKIGPAASGEIALQMGAKIQAVKAEFGNAIINGDSTANVDSFDGLNKALTGSTTEVLTPTTWAGAVTEDKGFQILEDLDNLMFQMLGEPSVILANRLTIAKIKSASRRLAIYNEIPGPTGAMVPRYGNIVLQDAGKKAGTNADVIPIVAGKSDIYAMRIALDGFHAVSTVGGAIVQQWLPDYTRAGAVKTGEVELGPVAVVLKATRAAAVLRQVQVA